ncbi:ATP-binding protein [Planosporangium flavigriseum]|uniref:histidine kinase n=2 Tax=Planosporangium flavigriseum TaxID=373681 RepID=A0A8J3LS59_9ACTN|nr:histidine kinase [Planosporangium flavigriseum]
MARRLDPTIDDTPPRRVIEAEPAAQPSPPVREDPTQAIWPAICEQFALRILASAYQMGIYLEDAEADEQDADKLEKLYRIDHANTRIRRQAENLQVLLGRKVDDADRQVTSLLDVIRAASSAIEYYPRVQIGQIVNLSVVEFAADDVIRVLTELLDNSTRFSPPTSPVIVSAYITETGNVLMRIEDAGVGIKPDHLPALNAMLAGAVPPALDGNPASHLGLVVVSRLAVANQMRVHLTNRQSGGTTTHVLIPDALLCEVAPRNRMGAGPAPLAAPTRSARPPQWPPHRTTDPTSTYQGSAQVPGAHLMLINGEPGADGGRPSRRESSSSNGLPRRVRESLRDASSATGAPAVHSASTNGSGAPHHDAPYQDTPHQSAAPQQRTSPESAADRLMWPDETADFAAGISDAQWSPGIGSPSNDDSEGNQR